MIQFRVRYLLEAKGISNPYNFLIKIGYTPNVATRLLNGKAAQLKLIHVNRFCMALNCTPNDMLAWRPTGKEVVAPNHQLQALARKDTSYNLIGHLNRLTLNEIKEVENLITEMEEKKTQPQ